MNSRQDDEDRPGPDTAAGEEAITFFQLTLLVLSFAVFVAIVTDSIVKIPPEASKILQTLDLGICAVFFIDFVQRFGAANSKLTFMKWGWIDLIACIPNIDMLRWGRMGRVLRIIRILRTVRSFQRLLGIVFRNRIRSGLGSVCLISVLLITFSSVAILMCEEGPDSNIKSAEDAVWWSITTITTVGYGDKYPITTEGRLIAIVLMFSGVGMFGTLSGLVASYFVSGTEASKTDVEQLSDEIRQLRNEIRDLSKPTGD